MSQLIVRLFGPPTVEWDGVFLPVPRRKVRALFFRLALDMQPVAREHLTDLLWCDASDAVAHRDLTHIITHLRNALPDPELVQCTADFLFLDTRRIWCDTIAFLQVLRRHHVEPTTDNLIEAASLVRGALLDGFSLSDCPQFEEWLTIERSVWERRYLAVVDALARESRYAGDSALLIQSIKPATEDEPMDPETHRRMVAARLAGGDTDKVHRIMDACRGLIDSPPLALADRKPSK